ncbi:hypothetical protein RI578_22900 [Streptomyces sp. BB1-1-1]|uniref:hypothetical protein n=1 Tax=Streptomyces sp. BB1-1-1 TaxID=3074430 RepID=UPI00287767EE|nr:hypothetical protein [Streptomyces sp. BB1-1-1]WND36960.1 hypothetical protein RI578_22900 [Streptomyces sp. BB1-1-1]
MSRRHLPAVAFTLPASAYAVLLVGLAMGVIGLIGEDDDIMRAGMLLGIAALPALIVGHIRHAHRVADEQLADAHRAGYVLALDHVARGLLDQHNDTPPHGHRYDLDDLDDRELAARVVRLHRKNNGQERQAG